MVKCENPFSCPTLAISSSNAQWEFRYKLLSIHEILVFRNSTHVFHIECPHRNGSSYRNGICGQFVRFSRVETKIALSLSPSPSLKLKLSIYLSISFHLLRTKPIFLLCQKIHIRFGCKVCFRKRISILTGPFERQAQTLWLTNNEKE